MILERDKFCKYVERYTNIETEDNSPLWIPEQSSGIKSNYFLICPTFNHPTAGFWEWNDTKLIGQVRCYYLDHGGDTWWGFTEKDDITLFLLRWV